ncbi:hypothetical protein KA531_02755 [Candidatus Saccharibacteria bacterium]|nr:hypothetical protein [Candidatus Saccharibacteria bacterium]
MQNYGQMIDKELIKELGLDQIHRDKLEGILDELAVILQPALSDKLESSLTDQQLDQFDQFLIKNDEVGAFRYLQQQIPNFTDVIKAVISDQKEILRSRVEMLIGGDPSLRAASEDQSILASPQMQGSSDPQSQIVASTPSPLPASNTPITPPPTTSIAPPPKSYSDRIAKDKQLNTKTDESKTAIRPKSDDNKSNQSAFHKKSNNNAPQTISGIDQAPHAFNLHGGNYNDNPNYQPNKMPGNINSQSNVQPNINNIPSVETSPDEQTLKVEIPDSQPSTPSSKINPPTTKPLASGGGMTPSEQTATTSPGSIPQSIPPKPFSPKPVTDWMSTNKQQSSPSRPSVSPDNNLQSPIPAPSISSNNIDVGSSPSPTYSDQTPTTTITNLLSENQSIKIPDINAPESVPNIYEDAYLRSSFDRGTNPISPSIQPQSPTNPVATNHQTQPSNQPSLNSTYNPYDSIVDNTTLSQSPTNPSSSYPEPSANSYAPPKNNLDFPPASTLQAYPTDNYSASTLSTSTQSFRPTVPGLNSSTNQSLNQPAPSYSPTQQPVQTPPTQPAASAYATPMPSYQTSTLDGQNISTPIASNTAYQPPSTPLSPPIQQPPTPTPSSNQAPNFDYTNPATNPNHPLNSIK